MIISRQFPLLVTLSLIICISGSECDDAVSIYRGMKTVDVVYLPKSDIDCCFLYPVVCLSSDDGALFNPPQITEL